MIGRSEFEFANDVRAAMEEQAPRTAWLLVSAIAAILLIGFVWSLWATIEEVTTGEGRVIPSSQTQVVQTLERGIIREILLREGDLVEQGQVLMRIDDTGASSQLGELRQRRWALLAENARLEAEADNKKEIDENPDLKANAPQAVLSEAASFRARRRKLDEDIAILEQQAIQKEQELLEFEARQSKLEAGLKPLMREVELTRKLHQRGVIPEVEMLRLERQEADQKGELEIVRKTIPRARAAVAEITSRIANTKAGFQSDALERLARARAELAVIDESIKAAQDRVVRTALKAPVRGIVNKLNINTIGAVVQPGQDLIEIVPLDDKLLIEANVRPQDVAFIRPEQEASVKLTAYDYLIYGALEGKVERISADTISGDQGETFYRVIVRTDRTHIRQEAEELPIIPGMVATVDIQTGRKTVFDYLMKPIRRVRNEALRER
jgi:adhesin transport system membrane fusion protein